MSIYDHRDKPAYEDIQVHPIVASDSYIAAWWSPEHDAVLERLVQQYHWLWYWEASEGVLEITSREVIEEWKRQDPMCRYGSPENLLMKYAIARAEKIGLTRLIRQSQTKRCGLCRESFREDSLPFHSLSV